MAYGTLALISTARSLHSRPYLGSLRNRYGGLWQLAKGAS